MVKNHYLLLGIPEDADQKQIKTVYRDLAKRFHPDRNKGSEAAAELFRQVNLAYRVLSDPQRRQRYDAQLKRHQGEQDKTTTFTPSAEKDPEKFKKFLHSLLDAIFGPAGQPSRREAGQAQTAHPRRAQPQQRPDFNFYYHLAMEKQDEDYSCGRDGVYRRKIKRKPAQTKSRRQSAKNKFFS